MGRGEGRGGGAMRRGGGRGGAGGRELTICILLIVLRYK